MTGIPSNLPISSGAKTASVNPVASQFQTKSNEDAVSPEVAANVTISPEAKAKFERLQAELDNAEKLSAALLSASAKTGATKTASSDAAASGGVKEMSYDDLFKRGDYFYQLHPEQAGEAEGAPKETVLTAISPEEAEAGHRKASEAFMFSIASRHNAEGGQALKKAIADGTVRVRRAEDVPGVNYKTTVQITQNPYSEFHTTSFNPSPEIQAEIDSGHAIAMWTANQGDVYITW